MCSVPLLDRVCRECYSDAGELYATLKRRGMNLVTVTDHDSIDAAEPLRRYPDFFLSEEVSCRTPHGTQLHLGVYDLTERNHIEIQRRRDNLPSLMAYLSEQRLFFSINHLFSSLTGRRVGEDFDLCAAYVPAAETLNGHVLARNNRYAAHFAARQGMAPLGGSDAHTLRWAGRTWTEVECARNTEEFFAGIRAGCGRVAGECGSYWKLTGDVFLIAAAMMEQAPQTMLLAPLAAAIPVWTLANYFQEVSFAQRWKHALRRARRISAAWPGWLPANSSAEVTA
jgi:predicted metal-dependent phosphoesterase TrpH